MSTTTESAASSPGRCVREVFRRHPPYVLDRTPCAHKLDQNEVCYPLPPPFQRRIAERLATFDWTRYPDFHAADVRAALGERLDWPADGILVGNGSGELLLLALNACVAPGQEILTVAPSFSLYPLLFERTGAVPVAVPTGDDLRLPLDALERAVEENPRRPLMLCSPNNPTGEAVSPERLERLLERLEAPLFLDNAYGEFCGHDYLAVARRHRHLLIFRTFSKALSLAGMRLGYLLCDPDLATELYKVKLPYKINFASAAAGIALLEEWHLVERRVAAALGRRPQWAAMFESFGFEVLPSETNFLLVRHPAAAAIRDGLEARSIRVRKVGGHPAMVDTLRVSVGDGRALRAVRRALEEMGKTVTSTNGTSPKDGDMR